MIAESLRDFIDALTAVFFWGPHSFICTVVSGYGNDFCDNPQRYFGVIRFLALLSVVTIAFHLYTRFDEGRENWRWRIRQRDQQERERQRAAEMKMQAEADAIRDESAARVREQQQRERERVESAEIAQEQHILRMQRRLIQIEQAMLREYAHFRMSADPLGTKHEAQLKREFGPTFIKDYPADAPLGWASQNVEVRAIVSACSAFWPKPDASLGNSDEVLRRAKERELRNRWIS